MNSSENLEASFGVPRSTPQSGEKGRHTARNYVDNLAAKDPGRRYGCRFVNSETQELLTWSLEIEG
jgi:hypothetical protein